MSESRVVLYQDQWLTVAAEVDRFVVTWLNRSAQIASVKMVFVETYSGGMTGQRRAKIGKALVGPDGGTWLSQPELALPRAAEHDTYVTALQLAVDYLHTKAE